MIYLNTFDSHASYEEKFNGGGVDFKIPNVRYCKDANDVHFNPYNLIEFYVGEITSSQTVNIFTDDSNFIPIQVSKDNKWYSYVLPKNKGLCMIGGDSVKKVVVKADIYTSNIFIIPSSTVEASFKGSNTSNVTNMDSMFYGCSSLTSLDLSGFDTSKVTKMGNMFDMCSSLTSLDLSKWDTSKVTKMNNMFYKCSSLTSLDLSGWNMSNVTDTWNMFKFCTSLRTIRMVGCTTETRTNIEKALTDAGIKDNVNFVTE